MLRILKTLSISIIFVLITATATQASMPSPTGFVTDAAGVLSGPTKEKLESYLSAFEQQTGMEIAVVTVPTLDEMPIEDYAVQLFKKWGIGKKGKDNGALFIVAPKEHHMRIEVGYGLEGDINDALAGRILDQVVLPRLKAGDMDGGIAAGTVAIVQIIAKKENIKFDAGKSSASLQRIYRRHKVKSSPLKTAGKILLFIFMAFMFIRHPWLFLLLFSMGGGGGVGGRGFGGGFGGFGGGLSGGGGASRGW